MLLCLTTVLAVTAAASPGDEAQQWEADLATPLHRASRDGDEAEVRRILDAGEVEVDAPPGESGTTALQLAAGYGHEEIVRLLIERGAYVDRVDSLGGVALIAASAAGMEDAVIALLRAKASLHLTDGDGWGPLHFAVGEGHAQIVSGLVRWGADVNARTSDGGYTPLHIAAENNRLGAALELMQHGADPFATCFEGKTALAYAVEAGYGGVESVLALEMEKRMEKRRQRAGDSLGQVRATMDAHGNVQ